MTALDPASIRVESDPHAAGGSARAVLRVTEDTHFFWPDGAAADQGDLRLGARVRAWVEGPVMESDPVQATAAAVVVESTTEPVPPGI